MNVKPYHTAKQRTAVQILDITHQENDLRLDRFLKEKLPNVPLSLLQKILRTGQVRVNSKRKKGNYRLVDGDKVRIPPMNLEVVDNALAKDGEKKCPPGVVREIGQRILYRDDSLLVINKPAAMVVHGGSGQGWGVVDAVREFLAQEENSQSTPNPELCHRLDRDTTGCLLFGLGKYATRILAAAFRDGSVQKEYVTLVKGCPDPAAGLIDKPLQKGVIMGGERMVVASGKGQGEGQEARTRYKVAKKFTDAALVNVTLETGRTHQIRAHFLSIGHPLAGDPKYGDRTFNQLMKKSGLAKLFLHARSLQFQHPESKETIEIVAPLDPAVEKVLAQL